MKLTKMTSREMREAQKHSETDWERVAQRDADSHIPYDPEDCPFDPNDPVATKKWFDEAVIVRHPGQRGRQKSPTKVLLSLRLSRDVVEHFRSTGPGWQTRIDDALRQSITPPRRKPSKKRRHAA